MREVLIRAWCDRCEALGLSRAEAKHTYTIGIVKGENRPALRVIELCDDCDAAEIDVLTKLMVDHSIPLDTKNIRPIAPAVINGRVECLICRVTLTQTAIVNHVWAVHRPTEKRPASPKVCPECRQPFGNGMAMHRNRMHGHSSLDDAYRGLI